MTITADGQLVASLIAGYVGIVVFVVVFLLGVPWMQRGALVLTLGLLGSGCVAYEASSVDLMNPTTTHVQTAEKKACMLAKKRGIACWQPEPTP